MFEEEVLREGDAFVDGKPVALWGGGGKVSLGRLFLERGGEGRTISSMKFSSTLWKCE